MPWINKGIDNSCKKIDALYREFAKERMIEKERKYKLHKNKHIDIVRFSKKDYYNNISEYSNNIIGMWKIFNSIIRNGSNNAT